MITKEITILDQKVNLAYCYGTEISYKLLADEECTEFVREVLTGLQDNRMPDSRKAIYLIMSAMTAYQEKARQERKKRLTACDLYQLIVGEYGISRHEFLYEMRFWEVRRVIRGYRRRNILHYQLQRINAWASMFCMGNPHHKEPADIVKLYFDDELDDAEDSQALTPEEYAALQAEMDAINAQLKEKAEE